jgi:hypothetical protein
MKPPTPQQLALRLSFSAQILATAAAAVTANMDSAAECPNRALLIASAKELHRISSLHQQTATAIQANLPGGSREPQPAARGTGHQVARRA